MNRFLQHQVRTTFIQLEYFIIIIIIKQQEKGIDFQWGHCTDIHYSALKQRYTVVQNPSFRKKLLKDHQEFKSDTENHRKDAA